MKDYSLPVESKGKKPKPDYKPPVGNFIMKQAAVKHFESKVEIDEYAAKLIIARQFGLDADAITIVNYNKEKR